MATVQLLPARLDGGSGLSLLLYAILRAGELPPQEPLLGIGDRPVFLIQDDRLGAAVSRVSPEDLILDPTRAMAYEKVIAALHRAQTVIPVRYGCLFEGESLVLRHLTGNARSYECLLEDLGECVEMGIRALQAFEPSDREEDEKHPGRAYLASQQSRYSMVDQIALEQWICLALKGLFIRHKKESTVRAGRCLLSLYFLVPGKAVESFCHAFLQLCVRETTPLLLSGPWPPYNFVQMDP